MHLISVTVLQNDQNWNKFKKAKRNFFVLPNANMPHILLYQHRRLTNCKNVCGAIFC